MAEITKETKRFLFPALIILIISLALTMSWAEVQVFFSPEQGEEILAILKEAVQEAEERIYVLIYSFTLDELAEALIGKHKEGIDVKIIMDKGQAGGRWSVDEKLEEAGINVKRLRGSKSGYMHIKMIIVDNTLMTGSYNWSKNATYKSDENFLVITDEEEVLKAHLGKFERLWGRE